MSLELFNIPNTVIVLKFLVLVFHQKISFVDKTKVKLNTIFFYLKYFYIYSLIPEIDLEEEKDIKHKNASIPQLEKHINILS